MFKDISVLILFLLKTAKCSWNIETKEYLLVIADEAEESSKFGATVAFTRTSANQITLYVGAPHYNRTNSDIREGTVYKCELDARNGIAQECSEKINFGKSGSMGISMALFSTDELLVCGSQYVLSCPDTEVKQRLVGSCYTQILSTNDTQEIPSPCSSSCSQSTKEADIMFVLDESGSLTNIAFRQQLDWIIQLLAIFRNDIDSGSVQVGVILFNFYNRVAVALNTTTFTSLSSEITSLFKNGGGTRIGKAMNAAIEEFLSRGRRFSAKLMIVLTDGASRDSVDGPASTASSLGITTIGVGVGDQYNFSNLMAIANQDRNRVFEATDYSNLNEITTPLQTVIVQAVGNALEGQITNKSNLLTQCQIGSSIHTSNYSFYVGAVGSYDRSGSVVDYTIGPNFLYLNSYLNETDLAVVIHPENVSTFTDSYLGYSVTSGRFYNNSVEYIASGAPAFKRKGAVLVYNKKQVSSSTTNGILYPKVVNLWQLGAYFGHTVVSADLNNDLFDDLLVSAPLYASGNSNFDQGRVFVFRNDPVNPGMNKWGALDYQPTTLYGSNADGSRFGFSISIACDLDRNGYNDVIIGAPYEETGEGSRGAIYVYFVDANGISNSRKQRIASNEIVGNLKGFGAGLLNQKPYGFDVDENGYPDVIASAPSSDSLVILFSKPVIDVIANISLSSSSINVINCLRHENQSCLTLILTMSARERTKTDSNDDFDIEVHISLDSLVSDPRQKRLFFEGKVVYNMTSAKNVSSSPTNFSYEITLNPKSFDSLDSARLLDVMPQIKVEWILTERASNNETSPVLDLYSSNLLEETIFLDYSCLSANGNCFYDLDVAANFSISQSADPYILENKPSVFTISVTAANLGPDYVMFMRMDLVVPSLVLNRVIGSCAQQIDITSGITTLAFKSQRTSPLNVFIFPNQTCEFKLTYPLEPLSKIGSLREIIVNGKLYSSLNDSRWKENETANNEFNFRKKILYNANLFLTRNSNPFSIIYNRTENTSVVGSILDPILGGLLTDIEHSYDIINSGPHAVAMARVTLKWPAFFDQSMTSPLLYLYKFSCEPSSQCQCNINGKVNQFNLSLTNRSNANVSLVFPPLGSLDFKPKTTCNDVYCDVINCEVTELKSPQVIKVNSSFKLWLPTLSQPKLSTTMSSELTLNTSDSPLYRAGSGVQTLEASVTVAAYESPPPLNKREDWPIIVGVVGALIFLAAIVLALKKFGFFESKYAKKKQLYQIENHSQNNVDPN